MNPAEAHMKITCRLAPGKDPSHVLDLLEKHAQTHCPQGATLEFARRKGKALPYAIEREHPGLITAADTLRNLFGRELAVVRIGGTIPIAEVFKQEPNADLVFFTWSLPNCNAHAPNEWFRLEDFRRGTVATCAFLERLGRNASN